MNSKAAKRLRREIYGDQSIRQERVYRGVIVKLTETGQRLFQVINDPGSLRARYQKAKS